MYKILKEKFNGKKVFLTGHTGFKGAWMWKILSILGSEVKGYSLQTKTEDDLFNFIEDKEINHSIIADIRDKERLEKEINLFQPDYVFHLAAQPLVRESYRIPSETFEVNVIGTANVLDAIKTLDKKCSVLIITTDKVYFNNEWDYPYRELDRLGGYDPYSASKACAELLIDSYRNSFFNLDNSNNHKKAIAVARAGNVIGGGDWSKDRIVPDIVKSMLLKQKVVIRNPNSVRPWQHVLEPLIGYLVLAFNLEDNPNKYSQAFNFGPNANDSIPVEELVKLAINEWGSGEYIVQHNDKFVHEAKLLKLDISKANSELNWRPQLNSKEAISLTIDWYKTFNKNKSEINDFTTSQILKFLNSDK